MAVFDEAGSPSASSIRPLTGWRRPASSPATGSPCNCPNIPQFLISYFGILKAGGVVMPLKA